MHRGKSAVDRSVARACVASWRPDDRRNRHRVESPTRSSRMRFPDGFLWGTAVAAHQVEGNNWANDWWAWEHDPTGPCVEPSGDACDFYHRYREDLALLKSLGHQVFRLSVEWS